MTKQKKIRQQIAENCTIGEESDLKMSITCFESNKLLPIGCSEKYSMLAIEYIINNIKTEYHDIYNRRSLN